MKRTSSHLQHFLPPIVIMVGSLLLFFNSLQAQQKTPPVLTTDSAFVHDAKAAVDSLYNLRFDEAGELLEEWRKQYPDHPVWAFWEGMELWWHILPDLQNKAMDDALFKQLGKAGKAADRVLQKEPHHRDALLVKALSHGLMARQYANRSRWLKSINQARHAVNMLSTLKELDDQIPDLLLGRGLLKYYTAYLPEAYPIVRTVIWMLPEGDKKKGLALMKEAAEKSIYVRPEALYFLGKIYMNHEREHRKAIPYFQRLYKQYSRNPYYATQYIRVLVRADRRKQALAQIDTMLSRSNIPYRKVLREELLAWKGRILYKRDQYKQAREALLASYKLAGMASLPNGTERPFHVMAGYYLGRVHEAQGNAQQALGYYQAVAESNSASHYREKASQKAAHLR